MNGVKSARRCLHALRMLRLLRLCKAIQNSRGDGAIKIGRQRCTHGSQTKPQAVGANQPAPPGHKLSFESNYERGLSAAGEKLHSGACSVSPAAESPRSYCRLNRTMNADFAPPGKICMHLNAVFLRRRKVRVHTSSSIQTTVLSFQSNYCHLNQCLNQGRFCAGSAGLHEETFGGFACRGT